MVKLRSLFFGSLGLMAAAVIVLCSPVMAGDGYSVSHLMRYAVPDFADPSAIVALMNEVPAPGSTAHDVAFIEQNQPANEWRISADVYTARAIPI